VLQSQFLYQHAVLRCGTLANFALSYEKYHVTGATVARHGSESSGATIVTGLSVSCWKRTIGLADPLRFFAV